MNLVEHFGGNAEPVQLMSHFEKDRTWAVPKLNCDVYYSEMQSRYSPVELSAQWQKVRRKYERRIQKETAPTDEEKDFERRSPNNQFTYIRWTVQDGVYKGQTHILEVKLVYGHDPDIYLYPINPPLCTFMTRIWHPNISTSGSVCLDVIKENWSPIMTIENVISSIGSMLDDPNPTSPFNGAAALDLGDSALYKKKVELFYGAGVAEAPDDVLALFAA
jgi:ubiquitin-protein ligase